MSVLLPVLTPHSQFHIPEAFKSICSPPGSCEEEGVTSKGGDARTESQRNARHLTQFLAVLFWGVST